MFVLLWLISSSVWADAVSKIKMYTNPTEYFDRDYACECPPSPAVSGCVQGKCTVTDGGNYATINVSAVSTVGWILVIVMWFSESVINRKM